MKKTVSGVETYYLLDGAQEVLELSSSGVITRRYVYGPSIDEPVVMWNGAGTLEANRKFYRADHQGTIIAQESTKMYDTMYDTMYDINVGSRS